MYIYISVCVCVYACKYGGTRIFHIQESKPLILNLTKRIGQNPATQCGTGAAPIWALRGYLKLGVPKGAHKSYRAMTHSWGGGVALNINPYSMFLCTLLSEFC